MAASSSSASPALSRTMAGPSASSGGRRSGLLKYQIQPVKSISPEGKERYGIVPIPDTLSFDKGFFLFIRAIQMLTQRNEGVVLVGLAGPSGAGKTVFSEKLASFMPGIVVISMDNYNDATRVIDGNYDDPRLTDYDTLLENIQGLRMGKAVDVPIYDFKKSSRVGTRRVEVPQSRIVVIEGIYALSERLRPLLDLRVSITGGVHFDLVKRVLRDINRSGQEPEDIIHQISETVYPMYKAFIEPDLQTAHIKIVNKFNPFSGFQNATYILKSAVHLTEEQIRAALPSSHTEAMEETYDIYLLPPGEDRETCQSYLRMRNRDGRYSLMFEEWVTDGPFIISPRITFEVSVRLLGGLMALGYEIASILKRVSHVFTDIERHCTVKIDKLEQLQRTYVQVQGKDRLLIQELAEKLGMDAKYVPRSYIEQIQLERLTKEVQTVPEELKERLGVSEDLVTSPQLASSWGDPTFLGNFSLNASKTFLRSQSWHQQDGIRKQTSRNSRSSSQSENQGREEGGPEERQKRNRSLSDQPNSPTSFVDSDLGTRVTEQLQSITERLDELMSRLRSVETRLPEKVQSGGGCETAAGTGGSSAVVPGGSSAVVPGGGSWRGGSAGSMQSFTGMVALQNGISNGGSHGHGGAVVDTAALADEVRLLVRGQRHMAAQLDMLGGLIRDFSNPASLHSHRSQSERSWWDGLLGSMKTGHSGLATMSVVGVAAILAVGAVVAVRNRSH